MTAPLPRFAALRPPIGSVIAPLIVLALAAAARLLHLDAVEFNVDQAYPIGQALLTVERGALPLLGQGTSVLFANPPLAGYLYVPLLIGLRSAGGVLIAVALLNSLGVALSYSAVRGIAGGRAAAVAALLLIVNPWVIEYSRATWVQGLLPFYAGALVWLLWPLLTGRTAVPGRRWIGAGAVVALAAGSYLLGYALIIPIGLWLAALRRHMAHIPRWALIVGGAIVVVPTVIYAAALMTAPTATDRLESFAGGEWRISSEALDHALRLVSGRDYPAARGVEAPAADAALRQTLTDAAHVVMTLAIGAGLISAFVQRRRIPALLLPVIGFTAPVIVMTVTPQIVHPFYQLISLPSGAALAGIGIARALDALPTSGLRRLAWTVAGVGLTGFAALALINSLRFAEATLATPSAHDLGALPIGDGLRVGAVVAARLPAAGAAFADMDEWTLSSLTGRTFTAFWREIDPARTVILPAGCGVYVHMGDRPGPFTGSVGTETVALADGGAVLIESVACGVPPADLVPLHAAGVIDGRGALDLIGYQITTAAADWEIVTAWQVTAAGDETANRLFAPFAHVFDAAGTRTAIVDGGAIPGYVWRPGDIHIHRMTFTPTSTDVAAIGVGQYDGGAGVNILFDGAPIVTLPSPVNASP